MSTRQADISLDLSISHAFHIASCRIVEGISQHTSAMVEISTREDIDFQSVLGEDATLRLTFDGIETRHWTLRVYRVAFVGGMQNSLRYRIELYDRLFFLRLSTNTRKFRNQSAHDIITFVLNEGGVPFVFQTTRETPKRKYCSQYRESNLAFVCRLLEFEGIYFTVDPEGTLILADKSSASPPVGDKSHFELVDAAGAMDRDEIGIYQLSKGAQITSGAFTANDFNWKRPNRPLIATSSEGPNADLEVYDYPTGYRNADQGEVLARLRREALSADANWVEGEANVESFAAGHVFSFGDRGGDAFVGEYLLTRVEHAIERPGYDSQEPNTMPRHRYRNQFHAIFRNVAFRPLLTTPRPTVQGCHTAMVRGPVGEEIHTDRYGRAKVQFHWDREATSTDSDSRWIRMLQESSTSMGLARVGWEIAVSYIDGDPDRPVGIARHINGRMIPAYTQPANKNMMTIKTRSSPATGGYNELRLDDSAAAMRFDLRAERELAGIIQHNRTEFISNCEDHFVNQNFDRNVRRDQTSTVGANQTVLVAKDERLTVGQHRNKTVSGNETVTVKASMVEVSVGNDTETIGGQRKSVVGSNPMEGAIRRTIDTSLTRTIAGSVMEVSKGNIASRIGGDYTESVGGNKITTACDGSYAQTVVGSYTMNIGGGVMRQSGKAMGISSTRSFVTVGSSVKVTAGELVQVTGTKIQLEAAAALTLQAPGLSIAMTPGMTTIVGKLKLEAPSQVVVTGSPDNMTR